jgi:hypothetical protein
MNVILLPPLTRSRYCRGSTPAGVRQYRDLHENIIAADTAFTQIALEYEIESLSLTYGAKLVTAAD